jgi:vacuolar protein sorting-associated protein VTA1
MAAQIPPSLKLITSACRRAEELEKDPNQESQVVAYYCRFFVVSKGSKLCSSPPSGAENAFLNGEMVKLEQAKPKLGGLNSTQASQMCRSYANSVFEKADDEDRQGVADKATAKIFYASGTFFEILEQFGEIDTEVRGTEAQGGLLTADCSDCCILYNAF